MVRSCQAATGGPRKRSIRRRIAAKSARGTAASASWKTTYRPWCTIRAPILMSFDQVVEPPPASMPGEAPERALRLHLA
jgi:hypothetical protein